MPRPRHKPRPPGNVLVCCTGRGKHDLVRLHTLQLKDDGGIVRVHWNQRDGEPPVTGFRAADDMWTFVFECGSCGRNPKWREGRFIRTAFALAAHQDISGDDNTPVTFDISRLDRA